MDAEAENRQGDPVSGGTEHAEPENREGPAAIPLELSGIRASDIDGSGKDCQVAPPRRGWLRRLRTWLTGGD